MILTVITPFQRFLDEGYVVETKTYPNEEIKTAEKDVFNRTHDRWVERGKIWLVNESNLDDCVLLQTWVHLMAPSYNLVMPIEDEGETEC